MAEVAALRILQNTFKKLKEDPVEGFCCIPNEDDFFDWSVYIEGPPDTPYERGIFEMKMEFPKDYPMMPPSLVFVSEFWHPNVYNDGKVCISILHPPGEDELSNENPGERWMPSQSVSSILLSVISMLNDPNFSSPANVDASVECRNDYKKYQERIKSLVDKANKLNGHIKIPHPESNPEERKKYLEKQKLLNLDFNLDDYLVDEEFGMDYGSGEDNDDFPFSDDFGGPSSDENNDENVEKIETKEKNEEKKKKMILILRKMIKKEEKNVDDKSDNSDNVKSIKEEYPDDKGDREENEKKAK